MDENKEFGMERDVLQPEEMTAPVISETEDAQTESRVEENTEPQTTDHSDEAVSQEEPYVTSPRIENRREVQEDPYLPRNPAPAEQAARAPRKKKSKGRFVKKCLACVAVLALVVSGCAVTAGIVNAKWEKRVDSVEDFFNSQLNALQRQILTMTPDHTGNSISGTVSAGNGMTAAQVYAQNVRSVVLIEATITADLFGQTSSGMSAGSGFILTEDGYVVTNYHVVDGATSVNVVLHDGTSYPAALVGKDTTNDLAVLKVNASGLDAVALGSSDDLIVGDQVVAIGNPLGELTATLTVGYVSAKERTVNTDGTIINMIQTDAAINSGNSGGPLFNMKGQVVGITTAKYSGASSSGATIEGIGFAIPLSDVQQEIQELIEYGYIKSAYLGVMVQNMDPSVASIYSLPVGAYVVGVEDGYCAQRAGVREKDIIVAVDEETVENINDLTRILRRYEPGDQVKLEIYRAGQVLEIPVKLDERPASAG